MMSLLFGERADAIHEGQSLVEIRKGKRTNNVVLIDHVPMCPLRNLFVNFGEFFAFERRDSTAAWDTGFGG